MRALLFTLMLLGLMRTDAEAQGAREWPEFTQEEFYQAFRRIMPEPKARRIARELTLDSHTSYEELGIPAEAVPKGGYPVSGVGYVSDDALMLLSLVSDETHRKVDRFRLAARGGQPFTAEEQRVWEERLAQFRKWKDAGYPIDPDEAQPPSDEENE